MQKWSQVRQGGGAKGYNFTRSALKPTPNDPTLLRVNPAHSTDQGGRFRRSMKIVILTYHSHHVLGSQYANNDHIAFAEDLDLITSAGYRIKSLDHIVTTLEARKRGFPKGGDQNFRYVGLTFDDGPVFDVEDFTHPIYGFQRSFLGVMRDFLTTPSGRKQPDLHATSFVIASPEARHVMESAFDEEYTFLSPGSLGDGWWEPAISSGLIAIGNHSWDHLHPALVDVAHSQRAHGDFRQVTTVEDADLQILQAARYIAGKTHGRAAPFFAYPFGHYNEFLTRQYMPDACRTAKIDLRAAFTVDPRPVTVAEDLWTLPRYVCGNDWKSPRDLLDILME